MADGRERTAEEREAARAEREARRARVQAQDPPAEEVHEYEDAEPQEPEDEPELPSGTRRVSRMERIRAAGKTRGQPHRRRHRRLPVRAHSLVGRIAALIALIAGAALIWFLVELFQPFHGSGHGRVTVTIPAHSSSSRIAHLLERDGVISSSFFFLLRATLAGERGDMRSGTYHLKLDMSYGSALKILTTPPPPVPVTDITLIEGRTRRQIDSLLRAEGIRGSYLAATRRSPLLRPAAYGAPATIPSLEGFLFPSTYQLRKPVKISALVADQLRTFRARFATVDLSYARRRHLTPYDVLIVASMVQGEAQTARDRSLIASVIYNRLAAGMPLQIDATIRYATGNYSSPISVSQLHSASPWNTYVHKGLPPTPIDNPGLASIEAAAHPAATTYLYFVVKPCGNGEHAFASSYAQFLKEAQQYQSARARRGGRSPAHC
jgi:uncharacterized YceG family protein